MNKPKAFIMCGQCGSGKSYFAKQFAIKHNLRYLAIDDTYAYFNGDPKCRDNKFQVWMTFYQQVHAAECASQDVVIDVNNPCAFDRAEWLNWFSGFDHYLIWINAGWDTIKMNNANRERQIPENIFVKLYNDFEEPSIAELQRYNSRAKWKGAIHIINVNNHFGPMELFLGEWPYKE
jgi:predicted kinase